MDANHTSPATLPDLDRLLNEREAAQFVGFSSRALQNWRVRGGGPAFVKISARAVRYRKRDLIAWIDAHTRSSTSDSASA